MQEQSHTLLQCADSISLLFGTLTGDTACMLEFSVCNKCVLNQINVTAFLFYRSPLRERYTPLSLTGWIYSIEDIMRRPYLVLWTETSSLCRGNRTKVMKRAYALMKQNIITHRWHFSAQTFRCCYHNHSVSMATDIIKHRVCFSTAGCGFCCYSGHQVAKLLNASLCPL